MNVGPHGLRWLLDKAYNFVFLNLEKSLEESIDPELEIFVYPDLKENYSIVIEINGNPFKLSITPIDKKKFNRAQIQDKLKKLG